jgi:hypothetical protein
MGNVIIKKMTNKIVEAEEVLAGIVWLLLRYNKNPSTSKKAGLLTVLQLFPQSPEVFRSPLNIGCVHF